MDHEAPSGAVLLDEQSDPGQIPSLPRQNRGPRSLFFSGSQPEEPPIPSTTTPGPAAPQLEPDVSASGSESPSDGADESREETSSPDSSADRGGPLKPLGKAALKATTAKAVLIGSAMAHRVAARTEGQRVVGLYLADEADAENIGEPIAEIMHRHGGVAGKAMNPDTNDALQAIMGLANYVSKQVIKAQQATEVDGHLAAGGTLDAA